MAPKTSETPDNIGYVARFGCNPRTILLLVGGVVFVIGLIWMPIEPSSRLSIPGQYLLKVVGIPFFGIGVLAGVVAAARGGVALRIDREGITLGRPRVIPQLTRYNRALHVAWDDVAEVVLFHLYVMVLGRTYRYPNIGLRLRPGTHTTATTFDLDSWLWRIGRASTFIEHVPEDVLVRSQPIMAWRLDERRLRDAVARCAPRVRVIRLDKTGTPQRV
jgi:hypothetical protein